jgi:hypothetical protein
MRATTQALDDRRLRASEASELHDLELRLLSAFGSSVGSDEVRRCLESAFGHYDSVPVRTYVMLLTERRAVRELRAMQPAAERVQGYCA